ncbi:MAG: hypothetical protein FWD98_01710 [Defluviitaleaceae bacterium]|nr:hypothetical protein [Defluviitaleaceae bacterium]
MSMTVPAKKITSRQELAELKKAFKGHTLMRMVSEEPEKRREISVSMGTCGIEAGARDTMLAMLDEVVAQELDDVSIMAVDCMSPADDCSAEPIVKVEFPGEKSVRYKNVDVATGIEIVQQHLAKGNIVERAKI